MARKHDRQRKLEQKAKKASKRRARERTLQATGTSSRLALGAARGLDEAEALLAEGNAEDAIVVLGELRRRYPRRTEILALMAAAYLTIGDLWSFQATCERLSVVAPNQVASWLAYSSAAMNNAQPAAAHRALSHAAANWPDDPDLRAALPTLANLDDFLAHECTRRGMDADIGFRVLLLHDEMNLHLHRGKFDRLCDAAARLLHLCPTFAPALNNRSEAYFRMGRNAEAIDDCRRVLEFEPTNAYATANLARYLLLSGRFGELPAAVERLRATGSVDGDGLVKRAEAFALLADWEAVRETYRSGKTVWKDAGGAPSLAEHLTGVAEANLGNLKAARTHWRRAAKSHAPVDAADENLKDSKRPLGERHGPWAFDLSEWIPRSLIHELSTLISDDEHGSELKLKVASYLAKHPQIELVAPSLLERGDPSACDMLIRLAPLFDRPAIWEALKKFALGERGSDARRMQALLTLSQADLLEGPQQIWRDGVLGPVELTAQEIHCEATGNLPPEIEELAIAAHEALNDQRPVEAERLLDEALRLHPGDASAMYNRSVAIEMQGRRHEALEIVRALHREHPDYVFARTRLAEECIENGDLDGAKEYLLPLSKKARLHRSEHAAWSSANISLLLAVGELARAREVLKAWEAIDPDDHRIAIWKRRMSSRKSSNRLARLWRRNAGDG